MKVKLSAFAAEALAGKPENGCTLASESVVRAVQYYLASKKGAGPGWAYPEFLRDRSGDKTVELELGIDESLWASLELEAEDHDISTAQLLEHAVLCYVADLDAGRITEKMLDEDLEG